MIQRFKAPFHFFTPCVLKRQFRTLNQLCMLLILLFAAGNTHAADTLGFKAVLNHTTIKAGDTVEFIITAQIPEGWHLYSEKSDCPEYDGPIRADISIDSVGAFEMIGKPVGIGDHMVKETEIWKCSTGEFHGSCEFRIKVVVHGSYSGGIAKFYGQRCSNSDGTCYLVKETFVLPGWTVSAKP